MLAPARQSIGMPARHAEVADAQLGLFRPGPIDDHDAQRPRLRLRIAGQARCVRSACSGRSGRLGQGGRASAGRRGKGAGNRRPEPLWVDVAGDDQSSALQAVVVTMELEQLVAAQRQERCRISGKRRGEDRAGIEVVREGLIGHRRRIRAVGHSG